MYRVTFEYLHVDQSAAVNSVLNN